MSIKLDNDIHQKGTRFLIFPQQRNLNGFDEPEVVWISIPPHEIKPGPEDDRMFVVDATNKLPYTETYRPPYTGSFLEKVQPGPDGHFDHLHVDSREFLCAGMYAIVRRVLDIWEDYFGGPIYWHFEADFEKLELIPLVEWNNSQSGYGFLEFGYGSNINDGIDHNLPYCENFDVLAHELGHGIIYSKVGIPSNPADHQIDYSAMHESSGDLIAIISLLHFNSVVKKLLDKTKGNLFTPNELDRFAELSNSRQLRIAFNNVRMSDVGEEPHDRSRPLTGGIFDILVEVFQKSLVEKGLITKDLSNRSTQGPNRGQDLQLIQNDFNNAYLGHEDEFAITLLEARDYLGYLLAEVWSQLDKDFLTYHDILRGLFQADRKISNSKHQKTIRDCFAWRGISILPGSILLRLHTINKK
jgi:hypothetical protein